ncbi:kinase-like protein [Clavulina sp. PMI_390]|nr:kinase-like protein [Clavulina sp. PMI_390]
MTDNVSQLVHREAITHSQLHHPNILRFLGVHHETPESPPIVILPFCENGSLQDKLIGALLMETNEFDRIVAGITRGVTYLHFRNPPTIHGDLHPGNVLLDKDGNPCLCDFGLSRIRHEVTRTHTFVYQGGRARFLAPEISSGSIERISKESDIFGLAMTLFNAWTGKVPFSEITNEQQIRSIIGDGKRPERPTSTVALESEANASFWRLLVDMWVPEPYRRPSSATALWRLENPQAYRKFRNHAEPPNHASSTNFGILLTFVLLSVPT